MSREIYSMNEAWPMPPHECETTGRDDRRSVLAEAMHIRSNTGLKALAARECILRNVGRETIQFGGGKLGNAYLGMPGAEHKTYFDESCIIDIKTESGYIPVVPALIGGATDTKVAVIFYLDGESELDAYAPLPGNIFYPSDMRPFMAEEPHDYDKAAAAAGIDITWKDGLPYMPDGSQFDLLRNLTHNVDKLLEACSKALYVPGGTADGTDSDGSDDSEFIEIDLDEDDPLNVENGPTV